MMSLTPLESNPEVLTKYIHKLGVSPKWAITDVIGLDDELLMMLPRPVKALILLFPISDAYEKHRSEEHERIKSAAEPPKAPEELFYMRQFTHNACGTVALIHCVANNKDIELSDGVLKNFLENSANMTPDERGQALNEDQAFSQDHEMVAQEGQTDAAAYNVVMHHFIALVNVKNILFELDGRKSYPIEHGKTSNETFLLDAAKVCKEFIAREPNDMRFTVLAMTASAAQE